MAALCASAAAFAALPALLACSPAPSDSRIGIDAPDRASFDSVSLFLVHRCGTLDCHGNRQRNLVMWGQEGLRLDAKDSPGGNPTTEAEVDATYRSLVGLEPALMSSVIKGKGLHPELLTFVRKARGDEHHKGGALIAAGDQGDICIASWLGGAIDDAACKAARNPFDAGM